jgi:hypothetical protein
VRVTVDIDDALADECAARAPDLTWSELITAALQFALANADTEQPDQPSDDER